MAADAVSREARRRQSSDWPRASFTENLRASALRKGLESMAMVEDSLQLHLLSFRLGFDSSQNLFTKSWRQMHLSL
ncbi:MAG: hypothetical protein LJE91_14890 [Gammaproteobacteria bacterium]|jgi:hypothetical protein|nr:hypothetical protein [Gammaproteobacteria bacterium]